MAASGEMPLAEVLEVLSGTPASAPDMRGVLATTCARWYLATGEVEEAERFLTHALEMVPDLRPAMRLLYRIQIGRDDIRSAVTYLDQEIRATRHPREAAALYRERGLLVEAHFNDLSAAMQCYLAAMKATPKDLAVLRSVEQTSMASGDLFTLIGNLEAQLEIIEDPRTAAGVLRDLALLEARRGGDLDLAGSLLAEALEAMPGHLGLATDLVRIAEMAGDPNLLLFALESEADARGAGAQAMPLARASMALHEQRDRAGAIGLLFAAARDQPQNFSLWRNLEELSMSSSRYDVALAACAGQLRAMGDQDRDRSAAAEIYYRMGRLALGRLDRVPEGLSALRKALRLFHGHTPALEEAGRYLIANGMWGQLIEVLETQITTAKDAGLTPAEVALAHHRIGQVLEECLNEPDGAQRAYREALAAHAGFRPARDRLERVLHQLGRRDALRDFYRDELEAAPAGPRAAFLRSVLARLHAEQADAGQAIGHLVAFLKIKPDHMPSIQLLARLLARSDRPRELLRVTQKEIELTESPGRRAKLLHRAGELALEVGDPDEARQCFRRALDAMDDYLPSIEALEVLLRDAGKSEDLLELLGGKLLYVNDREQQASIRLERAALLSAKLDRPEDALEELEQILAVSSAHLPALHAAENLAGRLGRFGRLVELLETHVGAIRGPRTRALLLHRRANIRAHRLDDVDGAIEDLSRALELWPQLGVARALLLRLWEQKGRLDQVIAFAQAGLATERGADDRRAMALQLAELTPKPVVALQYLAAVAEARPHDYVTQIRLARASRSAQRPSREGGALGKAADAIAEGNSPESIALRYGAGRAHESAGNLDAADAAYAAILEVEPAHESARRGRLRIKERRTALTSAREEQDFEKAAELATEQVESAAFLTIAAERYERQRDDDTALHRLTEAVERAPRHLPALHARARILERMATEGKREDDAVEALEALSNKQHGSAHRARTLCRAATLLLRRSRDEEVRERAWNLFARALEGDPACDPAFRGLQRVRFEHGQVDAQPMEEILERRLEILAASGELDPGQAREIAKLAHETDGPDSSAALLEKARGLVGEDPGIHVDLAQAYARLGDWSAAAGALRAALELEHSPERRAALEYFAGEAFDRAGAPEQAIEAYLAAGRAGFHPAHAFTEAERLGREHGDIQARAEALENLVQITDDTTRFAHLRALASLHAETPERVDRAIELLRQLLLLQPIDVDVLLELHRLLRSQDRRDEAAAAVMSGLAHHRSWLRNHGLTEQAEGPPAAAVLAGIQRLFDAAGDVDGVYIVAGMLQVVAPEAVQPGRACEDLVPDPWPLPSANEGRPFELLVGDLPLAPALDLLREGMAYLADLPGAPPPPMEISEETALHSTSGTVMVVRSLAQALGIPAPLTFLGRESRSSVLTYVGRNGCLVAGRTVNTAPFTPSSRERIGRGLLRLATGGDYLHRNASDAQLLGVLVGLARAAEVELEVQGEVDERVAQAVASAVPRTDVLAELREAARNLDAVPGGIDADRVRETLHMAEDRAGVVCAADPRPALAELSEAGALETSRGTALLGFLPSDDHLALRRVFGYRPAFEIDAADVEEVPA